MKSVKLVPHESVDSQESIEMEEFSDDDDEVFLQNSRNGVESREATRPLMNKKKKTKNGTLHTTIRTSKPKYRRCCGPLCWMFAAFKLLIGVLAITIVLVNYFTHTGWYFWHWGLPQGEDAFAPCHDLKVINVWAKNFPKFVAEGNIRLINITQDSVLDIVLGYGTGADGYNIPDFVCDIYFGGQTPCFGGVMAVNGRSGEIIWQTWAKHQVFALTCQGDLNGDGTEDCVAGGRAGLFFALSGKTGKVLWEFGNHAIQSDLMSVYAAQFVHDLTGDGVPDILAVHGGDELSDPGMEEHMFGRVILFDGSDGSVLRWMQTPDRRESYYPPQILTRMDGEQYVLFGTGGNARSGALYVISLLDLYKRNISMAVPIYRDESKGMLTPAALVDITGDGLEDIVIATFNSHVIAFDGLSYKQIWNTSFANSESYSTIAVGYYDQDSVPDLIVKYQYGDGFPVYQYEQTVILSGRNGSKISEVFVDSIGSQSSPLSISVAGHGNDFFLHWMSNCKGHEKEKLVYSFPEGVHMHEKSRADICQALFSSPQVSQYLAFQRLAAINQTEIYRSLKWEDFEHANLTNTSALADLYLAENPSQQDAYNYADEQYGVLPFKKDGYDDAIALLQKEMQRAGFDDEVDNVLDPNGVAYVEGEEMPVILPNPGPKKTSAPSGEVIENIAYSQPHQVKKYPSELGGQLDNFEDPYPYQQQQAQYPQQQPQYPQQQYPQQQPFPQQQRRGGMNPFGRRRKRSIGKRASPYQWGIQRILATGSLAPSMLPANDTIDLIFSSHWIYPSKTPVLQAEDKKCVDKGMKEMKDKEGMEEGDYEALVDDLVVKCLKKTNHMPREDEIYETPSDYNPFAVNMGQTTLYRFTLRCECDQTKLLSGQSCGRILPFEQQGWPSFMGLRGDARFNTRPRGERQR